jgi:hypothetical protein
MSLGKKWTGGSGFVLPILHSGLASGTLWGAYNMKKKLIPDVKEILEMVDEKMKFYVKKPDDAKKRAEDKQRENLEKIQKAFFTDFTSITFGDYINAFHSFNRESTTVSMDSRQKTAYYTFFAYEESLKRLDESVSHIN